MKTIGNNIPFTGAEYHQHENEASYYIDGIEVASLEFDTDAFHSQEMSEEDKDLVYAEMTKAKERFEYNVKMAS